MSVHHRSPVHSFGRPRKGSSGLRSMGSAGPSKQNSSKRVETEGGESVGGVVGDEEQLTAPVEQLMSLLKKAISITNEETCQVVESMNRVKKSSPKISIKFRPRGTVLWDSHNSVVPGPGAYDYRNFEYVRKKTPNYSIPRAKI